MNKIRNISLFFRVVFQILLIVLPVTLIISWIYAPEEISFMAHIFSFNAIPKNYSGLHTYNARHGVHILPTDQWVTDKAILHVLTLKEKIIGCLVSAIPMLVKMFMLYCLIRLFRLYEKGDIFSMQHVRYIRNIGYAILAEQLIVQPVYQFVMGIVLTMNNPPQYRYASVTFGSTNISILFVAFLIVLISWIMAEGSKLREEQQLTI